jgi:hypothetical protein
MKDSFGFALALGVVFAGCGGTTRLGTTGEDGGSREAGGAPDDAGGPGGSGGAGSGGAPFTGGRRATGGRGSGGRLGSGGRPATGGQPFAGSGGDVDASLGGSGGLGASGRFFDAGGDQFRNRVTAAQACDRLTTIQCAAERYCCPRDDRSFDRCKQALGNYYCQYIDVWSVQPVVAYDIDRAQAAFDEFEKRASACDTTILPWAISDSGFRLVARGTIAPGGTCYSLDAGAPTTDVFAFIASCGVPEAYSCLPDPASNRAVCAPRSAIDGACYTDLNCLDGLFCDSTRQPPVCAPRRQNGAPCSTPLACESMRCEPQALRCVPATLESAYCLPY